MFGSMQLSLTLGISDEIYISDGGSICSFKWMHTGTGWAPP